MHEKQLFCEWTVFLVHYFRSVLGKALKFQSVIEVLLWAKKKIKKLLCTCIIWKAKIFSWKLPVVSCWQKYIHQFHLQNFDCPARTYCKTKIVKDSLTESRVRLRLCVCVHVRGSDWVGGEVALWNTVCLSSCALNVTGTCCCCSCLLLLSAGWQETFHIHAM